MKRLHRPDLYGWSAYQPTLRVDFNSLLWARPEGNVLFDPLPITPDDEAHLQELGGAGWIVMTNSDHVRGAREIAARTGARLAGPSAERETFPVRCDRWLSDGEEPFPGLVVRELHGSKTPGELAFVLDGTSAVFGDLVRAHAAGRLMLLGPEKLRGPGDALASVRRLRQLHQAIEHVLVGDGWCSFGCGGTMLDELVRTA